MSFCARFCSWIIVIGALACIFLTPTVYNNIVTPYRRLLHKRNSLVEQAHTFLTDPESACSEQPSKMRLRLKAPDFDRCEVARTTVKSSPQVDAFAELMEEMEFCKGGSCVTISTTYFGMFAWIFWGVVIGSCIVMLLFVSLIITFIYQRWTASYEIPRYMRPPAKKRNYLPWGARQQTCEEKHLD